MTMNIKGNVTVSTLHDIAPLKGTNPLRAALGSIYEVIARNIKLNGANAVTLGNLFAGGTYVGYHASEGMSVRSCHGDQNLTIMINAVAYNSVEPQAAAGFQNGSVEKFWWDYARNASTEHVPNPLVNMAALVEFNLESFTATNILTNLKTQTRWLVTAAPPAVAKIAMGAGAGMLPAADGPRLLYHIIGDFFVYSPNHYTDGYIVTDDNNDLLQTRHFL